MAAYHSMAAHRSRGLLLSKSPVRASITSNKIALGYIFNSEYFYIFQFEA